MTNLSTDRPSSDPIEDLFGHAPLAESLTNSICRYSGNDGLVLALYGPWGSGKSTVLSYVRHFLEQRTKEEQPTIVTFNPWWFLNFLSKFYTHTRSQTMGDWAVHLQPRLNPTWLEQYIDTQACYERLIGLRQKGLVPDSARESLEQFLKKFEMLKAGKNPDGVGAFDD